MKFLLLAALLGYTYAELTCPPGKVVNECGDLCQVTCKDVTSHNVPKACIEICNPPACVCPAGQALIRGQCVAYGHCWRLPPEDDPESQKLECPVGKVLDPCGDLCEVTCHDVTTNNVPKPCPKICQEPACVCPNGTALHRLSRTCVPYGACWRLPKDEPAGQHNNEDSRLFERPSENEAPQQNGMPLKFCGPDEVFSRCGRSCEKTCLTWHIRNPHCCQGVHIFGDCTCRDGYVRNEQGSCVPYSQCTNLESQGNAEQSSLSQNQKKDQKQALQPNNLPLKVCGPNEIFSKCGRNCEKTCLTWRFLNPRCCQGLNIPGDCTCRDGYVRNELGVCIPLDQCPKSESQSHVEDSSSSESSEESVQKEAPQQPNMPLKACAPNEIFSRCGRRCEKTCLTRFIQNPRCCRGPTLFGDCTCKDGYVRDEQGSCIPVDQCSNVGNHDSTPTPKPGQQPEEDQNEEKRCGRNMIFQECGYPCERTCRDVVEHRTPPIACIAMCAPAGCYCKAGFVRFYNGQHCVRETECFL